MINTEKEKHTVECKTKTVAGIFKCIIKNAPDSDIIIAVWSFVEISTNDKGVGRGLCMIDDHVYLS